MLPSGSDPGATAGRSKTPVSRSEGITSAPFLVTEATSLLHGHEFSDDLIRAVAEASRSKAKPLDNTDLDFSWRRQMVGVWVKRALEEAWAVMDGG